jgi:hypothetical protein
MSKKYVTLTQAALIAEAGIETIINGIVAGDRNAIGFEGGRGLPQKIPGHYFAIPTSDPGDPTRGQLIHIGPGQPDQPGRTWLDVAEAVIIVDGHLGWSGILVTADVQKAHLTKARGGAVSYAQNDNALIEKMRALRLSGEASSVNAAAGMVVQLAIGMGSEESKIRRLRGRYRRLYPT